MINVKNILEEYKGEYGAVVYCTKTNALICSYHPDFIIPLASVGKVLVGYVVAKYIEEGVLSWSSIINHVSFDPKEDSHIIYPHLQKRTSLPLSTMIEVMIACHDNVIANHIVSYIGGWEKVNNKLWDENFSSFNLTKNPQDTQNYGSINDLLYILIKIYDGYQTQPEIFIPLITGMVRQQDAHRQIPKQYLAHMTGGLHDLILDIGILGHFSKNPYIFVIAGNNVPNRLKNSESDNNVANILFDVYREWRKSMVHHNANI
ncbi:serine hydrolase [Cytobacillus sp. IB215316]|uniref:serine hydrolase n=1 Tax=Cytobacillus sp. IB215316 TaxID=3097354 RepID=UPI002A0C09BE|nr:serine hydrolase [Cytobacillus sp. IB215316]MDX8361700.1 serine hydrolase [Cytobacillus sp. IB215316]